MKKKRCCSNDQNARTGPYDYAGQDGNHIFFENGTVFLYKGMTMAN
jgi:hypothetical protein